MKLLKGKTALVTGASRGIGAAIAVGLSENGADVIIGDLPHEREALEHVKEEIEKNGQRAFVFDLDVTSKSTVENVVKLASEQTSGIDILVNNAGILKPSKLEDLSEADWDAHFDVNAKGILLMTNAILPQMKSRKAGRIINIASIAGRQGVATQGHYAATKSTAITLTRVYAQELGSFGINVNAICPGIILTEMGKKNLGSDAEIKHWADVAALKRLGQPDDIIGPVVFFASDLSEFVTGQALNVDGGIYFH